jgi:hypothetical protein
MQVPFPDLTDRQEDFGRPQKAGDPLFFNQVAV